MSKLWEILEWAAKILPRFTTVNPDEGAVVTRFGRCVKTLDEGGHYILIWPVIHEITTVTMTRQIIDVATQDVITSDGVSICLNASVEYVIDDPYRAIYDVNDFDDNIKELVGDAIRSIVILNEFDHLLKNSEEIPLEAQELVHKTVSDNYGVDILQIYLPTFTKGHTIRLIQQ